MLVSCIRSFSVLFEYFLIQLQQYFLEINAHLKGFEEVQANQTKRLEPGGLQTRRSIAQALRSVGAPISRRRFAAERQRIEVEWLTSVHHVFTAAISLVD